MKRLISLILLTIVIIFSFTSCSGMNGSTLTINEKTEIDREIFTYFLNEAYYGGNLSDEECINEATSKCLEYAAVNTRFAQMGKTLSQNDKAAVALEVNSLWRNFGDYLTEIGVSKDTFYKIKQYEYRKEDLRFALYDTGGTMAINEDYIKQYFTSNYVGIKYFYEELYTVIPDEQLESMSEEEKSAYDSQKKTAQERYDYISGIANYVNSGVYTMDEAFMAVTGEVSADISVSTTVVGRSDSAFSPEFIDAVFKQAVGSAFIITNADKSYLYFIERVDLMADEYNFYEDYRDRCLVALSDGFFVNEINSWVQNYNAVRHLSVVNRCFSKVKNVDRSKYVGTDEYVFKSFEYKE